MYHIIHPFSDGTVYHLMLGGKTVEDAFEEFRRYYWLPTYICLAVFQNHCLCARVVAVLNEQTGENEPRLEILP